MICNLTSFFPVFILLLWANQVTAQSLQWQLQQMPAATTKGEVFSITDNGFLTDYYPAENQKPLFSKKKTERSDTEKRQQTIYKNKQGEKYKHSVNRLLLWATNNVKTFFKDKKGKIKTMNIKSNNQH